MTCCIPKCREPTEVLFYGHEICDKHWTQHCTGQLNLKHKLRVKDDGQLTLR